VARLRDLPTGEAEPELPFTLKERPVCLGARPVACSRGLDVEWLQSVTGSGNIGFADDASRGTDQANLLVPVIFFLSPLATSATPRLTPFFFAMLALSLIGAGLRRGLRWRELLPRGPALAVCLLLAAYVCLNATWTADRSAGFGKAALFAGLVSLTFRAVMAALSLDERNLRRAAFGFAAGALLGGGPTSQVGVAGMNPVASLPTLLTVSPALPRCMIAAKFC
jgi:hypothetical protein